MTILGMMVFFIIGALVGFCYGLMVYFGISATAGLNDSPPGELIINFGTYFITFMLIVPVIISVVLVLNNGGPGTIGFAFASTVTISYLIFGIYKRIRSEREHLKP